MTNLSRQLAAALAGVASVAGPAFAEPINYGALEALFEEPVTTSAIGAPQRVTDAPVNMSIISQQDIRRSGAIDLPGVLERLANIDVMRTSAGQTDVSIRGYNSTFSPRLLVLLNGRQVYLDHYGMTNWDALPVQLGEIRQIEVVSGPNTALFGFNAVAGVVNIITYDALQDDIDEVSVRVGTPDYSAGSAIWTTRLTENLGFRLSVGGFDVEALEGDDDAALAFFGAESVDPMARSVALNAAYDVTPSLRADFEATWSQNQRTDRYAGNLLYFPYETNSFKLGLSAERGLGLWQVQIYTNYLAFGFEHRSTVGMVSLTTKPAPAHTLRIAGELRHNALAQGGGDLVYNVQSLSGMWNWQANAALAFTTAVRFDALELERTGTFVAPDFPFTNDDYDQAFTEWSYNLGAVYRVSDGDSLRLSGARGIGSPGLADYGFEFVAPTPPGTTVFVAGDPDAAPTIVYNLELGWDHEAPSIGGRARAALFWQRNEDIRAFASRLEVLSVFPTLVTALLPQPIGGSEMFGVELGLDGQNGPFLWNAEYSWRSIDDALIVSPVDVQANYEQTSPEHVFTTGVTWVGERFEIGGDLRYTSETVQYGQGAVLTGMFDVDAYVQANARVAWNASKALQIELSGRNLLETRTQTVGLTPVERGLYLTLRANF